MGRLGRSTQLIPLRQNKLATMEMGSTYSSKAEAGRHMGGLLATGTVE